MLKIICTSAKEKRELLEASEQINLILKKNNVNDPKLGFLSSLYRNPGSIEIVEEICVKRDLVAPKPRRSSPKGPKKSSWRKPQN